ncbi:MAG: hypothetical protein ACRBFS_00725 [Aureispira sp.]
MFKSKVDFNAFDTNNEKVANLEQTKIKGLSKASVKKLVAQPGERTPFHLVLDYFKDDKDKPQGHFLCFGVNKKMDKHFQQVEMKSGKLDKSMSASQKEASMGSAFVKIDGGKKLLCLEPDAASKIPGGKWSKILKALKPYLSGLKAVISIAGEIIGEEDSDDQTTGEETTGEDTTGTETTGEDTTDTSSDTAPETAGEESRRYKTLSKAFDKVKGKLGEWKAETDSKKKINRVKPLLKNVEKLIEHVDEFIGKEDTSESDKTAATEMKSKLDGYKTSLSQMDSTINKKKGEATVKGMDDLFAKIKEEANKIKGDHGDELSSLGESDDLAGILEELLA